MYFVGVRGRERHMQVKVEKFKVYKVCVLFVTFLIKTWTVPMEACIRNNFRHFNEFQFCYYKLERHFETLCLVAYLCLQRNHFR